MTKLRKRPTGYLTFLVEPTADFRPINWQQTPESYRIVEFAGAATMLGQADSWKFLNNQTALRTGRFDRWAIHISLQSKESSEVLASFIRPSDSLETRRLELESGCEKNAC